MLFQTQGKTVHHRWGCFQRTPSPNYPDQRFCLRVGGFRDHAEAAARRTDDLERGEIPEEFFEGDEDAVTEWEGASIDFGLGDDDDEVATS